MDLIQNLEELLKVQKNGFLTVNSIPLKRNFTKDGWIWNETKIDSENKYAERYFNIMEKRK